MPDLILKDSLGIRTLAKKIDISAAVATGITNAVGNVYYKQVVAKGKDNPSESAPETEDTGFVEETVLAELIESTVQIPENFAGLESVMTPTRLRNQFFEITEVHEMDGYVEITALHVFYQMRQNYTLWEPSENTKYSGASAIRNVMANTLFEPGFKVASDSTDMIRGDELDYARMNIVEAFLNPESGICTRYGLSLIRDNDTFYCLKDVGFDRGFVVQNKKNMLGVERTENTEDVITRVAPVGRDEDGNYVWLNRNGEKYIDSSHISEYPTPKAEIYITDIEIGADGTTAENIQQKLYEAAQKRFDEDEVDVPTVSMTVQFVSLGDTEEYKQYRDLDKVYLFDVIHIKDTERGYTYGAQVIAVQHNVLTGMLESVTIGTPQPWDGVRKIGKWQVPEITKGKIRHGSIRSGEIADGAVKTDKIANGAVTAEHMSQSADGHFKSIFAEELYISNTSEDGLLHTQFAVTEGLITSSVADAKSDMRSEIVQTASMIRSDVSASQSQIWSEVVQTASFIRSEVHNSLSAFYTAIIQTASNIVIRTGTDTRTYHQPTAPVGTQEDPLVDGDLWFNSEGQFTWSDAADKSWLDDSTFDWGKLKEADVYRYDGVNETWVQVINERAIMQDTKFEQNREFIQLVAGRVDVNQDKVESYRAEFKVEADQIRSNVEEKVNGLGSTITQTANQIRSEVRAESNTLRSQIQQTATSISMVVENKTAGLRSELLVTASQIRSSVSASNSQIYSTITQTASGIRSEVNSSISGLHSAITQQADRISLVVRGTGTGATVNVASIVAAVNDSGSSVIISADHINLNGYVKATDITSDFIKGKIANISLLTVNALSVVGGTSLGGTLTVSGRASFPGGIAFGSGVGASVLTNCIADASVSGNTLTLTKANGDTVTFSKATSLSGAWGSGVFTASASPQGETLTTSLTVGAITWSGLTATAKIYATIGNSGTVYETGKAASVDVSGIFNHLGRRELGYMDHGNFESVGTHDWYYL